MRRAGIQRWPLVEEIARRRSDTAWYREVEMSPMMHYIGKSLLECPFRGGLRLLHAESKALELLCEILATAQDEATANCSLTPQSEARQLNAARRLIGANVNTPLGVRDIAQAVGMSHSKLKRAFKERYGVTVCDYSLERRMHHALDLLRCKRMSVGQVAHAVGYRHQTSFASAFHDFFGFQPSKARTEMR
jgi:transcriptional regulator GlxA family with amidase domain